MGLAPRSRGRRRNFCEYFAWSPEPFAPELEPYHIHANREIISLLRNLQASKAPVTVYFDRGESFILTQLLAVNPEFEELVFDASPDEATNKRLVKSTRLIAVSFDDHVKVQFVADRAESVVFDSLPAFRVRVPDVVLRLQRREFYRVETPLVNPVRCRIPVPGDGAPAEATLTDISCGGLACISRDARLQPEVGQRFVSCVIEFPGEEAIMATLEVRHVTQEPHGTSGPVRRLRCKFVNLAGTMVTRVQRYIHRLERQRLAK